MPGPVGVGDDADQQHLCPAGPSNFQPWWQLDLEVELVGAIRHRQWLAGDPLQVPALRVGHRRGQRTLVVVAYDRVAAVEG